MAYDKFEKRQASGIFSSEAVMSARRELYDEVIQLGLMAQKEAEGVASIAAELKGDPYRSSKYVEAMDLVEVLSALKQVLDHTYNPPRALPAEDKP
jgi:hypothetical protein